MELRPWPFSFEDRNLLPKHEDFKSHITPAAEKKDANDSDYDDNVIGTVITAGKSFLRRENGTTQITDFAGPYSFVYPHVERRDHPEVLRDLL
jgi:hypothetical protein